MSVVISLIYSENNNGPRNALRDTWQNGVPFWLYSIYYNSLLPETEKIIYPFQSLSTNTITIQLAFKYSWGGVSKAFSKSKINVSTCPPSSKILARSFITVINWVSQLCLFRNACCLSDKNLCSSKCATILVHTMCSSSLHDTQVRETRRVIASLFKRLGIHLLETIPCHPCQ